MLLLIESSLSSELLFLALQLDICAFGFLI